MEANPILKVPHYRIRRKRGAAVTLSAQQVRDLLTFLEGYQGGKWVPYYALCLFAGIRPGVPHGEITKLTADAVNLESGIINVSAEVSKVREPRKVVIQPNLAAWLRAYPLNKFPIVLGNFKKRRQPSRSRGLRSRNLRHERRQTRQDPHVPNHPHYQRHSQALAHPRPKPAAGI